MQPGTPRSLRSLARTVRRKGRCAGATHPEADHCRGSRILHLRWLDRSERNGHHLCGGIGRAFSRQIFSSSACRGICRCDRRRNCFLKVASLTRMKQSSWGWVNRVFKDDELKDSVLEYAFRIARNDPCSVAHDEVGGQSHAGHTRFSCPYDRGALDALRVDSRRRATQTSRCRSRVSVVAQWSNELWSTTSYGEKATGRSDCYVSADAVDVSQVSLNFLRIAFEHHTFGLFV